MQKIYLQKNEAVSGRKILVIVTDLLLHPML